MTKPISPDEITLPVIPDHVFEAFNKLIKANFKKGNVSIVKRKDVVEEIFCESGTTDEELVSNGWLDIEPNYREAGWEVKYESPDWGQSFDSYFVFKKKKK
jgi:hypothetical protein